MWLDTFQLNFFNHQAIEELSPEKLKEYRDIFSYFDRDGGGSIGADEFEQVMRTFGWDPKEEELKAKQIIVSLNSFHMTFCRTWLVLQTRMVMEISILMSLSG